MEMIKVHDFHDLVAIQAYQRGFVKESPFNDSLTMQTLKTMFNILPWLDEDRRFTRGQGSQKRCGCNGSDQTSKLLRKKGAAKRVRSKEQQVRRQAELENGGCAWSLQTLWPNFVCMPRWSSVWEGKVTLSGLGKWYLMGIPKKTPGSRDFTVTTVISWKIVTNLMSEVDWAIR